MRLIFLFILLFPLAVSAVPVSLTWDANPANESIKNYTVYVNDTPISVGKNLNYDFEGLSGDCLSVSASNIIGESLKTDEICLPPFATTPNNIKIININITVN